MSQKFSDILFLDMSGIESRQQIKDISDIRK